MWMVALFACSGSPSAPKSPEEVVTPAPSPEPEATKPVDSPRLAERERVVRTVEVPPWGEAPEPCPEPCRAVELRPQASTERKTEARTWPAEHATDGDPSTAWCGVGGVGQRVSLALPELWDVQRIQLALSDVDGAGAWTQAKLVSDRRDQVTLTLTPPPPSATTAPAIALSLPAVQFLQLEVLALADEGPACIREIVVEGVPASVEGVEADEPEAPGDAVEQDPSGGHPAGDGPVEP